MFFEFHKRNDILRYMNLELKSENLLKVMYDVYLKTRGKEEVLAKMSEKTRKFLENKINRPEIIELEKQKKEEEEEKKKLLEDGNTITNSTDE